MTTPTLVLPQILWNLGEEEMKIMPPTTRQKILDFLKRNKSVSSREIARALHMTSANARYHLGILSADGRVEVVSQQQIGRGRPEKIYKLAKTVVGDNLSMLADALLTEADESLDIEAVGKRIAGASTDASQPLMRRLATAVDRLNKMHYQARWEAGAAGPRVILGQCPYATIIGGHPELCSMDTALLGELLGADLEQTAKLESGAGGVPFCAFELL
jgi:predicted ArsR family transcriptional regulator